MASAPPTRSITVAELAQRVGGRCLGDANRVVTGVNGLAEGTPSDVTFVVSDRHARLWVTSEAGAAFFAESVETPDAGTIGDRSVIVVSDAELATASALAFFAPESSRPEVGVHSSATVARDATVDPAARIGPGCVVGPRSDVAADVELHANVVLGADVRIGRGTVIHPGTVILDRCEVGEGVILHPNVTIGADGFGYRPSADGRRLVKMPHLGNVVVDNDVEVGAGTCIDRGKFASTRIGAGTKIDNLVQIAHNCTIGRHCVIAGCAAVGGSVTIGDGVMVGGAARISDQVTIGPGARLGGNSATMSDIPAGETWSGTPAGPHRESLRQMAAMRRLPGWLAGRSRDGKRR